MKRERGRTPDAELHGSTPPALRHGEFIGTVPAATKIAISLLLRPRLGARRLPTARELARTTYRPRGRAAPARSRGAAAADLDTVRRFAARHGLETVTVDQAARLVGLRGRADVLAAIFAVELEGHRVNGRPVRHHRGPVHLPAALARIVVGVFGLHDHPIARPHARFHPDHDDAGTYDFVAVPRFTAPDLAALYGFPEGDGKGQRVGVVELGGGYRKHDLRHYFRELGLPTPEVACHGVGGARNAPTGKPTSADGEVMLDIEVMGSLVPRAKIVAYMATDDERGFLHGLAAAIHDGKHAPSVVSMSWGAPESSFTKQGLAAIDRLLQEAASIGVTVCVSSGDLGSSDSPDGGPPQVSFPASSSWALACGGTSLTTRHGSIVREVVWNDLATNQGASGGGISTAVPLPSYQKGASVPPSVHPRGHVGRGVPDVAAHADPKNGYRVRVDGVDTVMGGTSASAPLWAGLVARLNQRLRKPVGFIHPLLYGKGARRGALRDIVKGGNGAYRARKGWDGCTGLGSPHGAKLAQLFGG